MNAINRLTIAFHPKSTLGSSVFFFGRPRSRILDPESIEFVPWRENSDVPMSSTATLWRLTKKSQIESIHRALRYILPKVFLSTS